jgi:hypothetical protein
LTFAADSRRLVSGSEDTTALVWDLTRHPGAKGAPLRFTELSAYWADLKSEDAARAYKAVCSLGGAPAQAIPFLNKHLEPVAAPDVKNQAVLIADLNSDTFAKRQKAMMELTRLGELAEPALRQALDKAPSPEARQRIMQLLARLETIGASGEPLRQTRAVEALERMGTAEARQLLDKLAAGAPAAILTREAQMTLDRLRLSNK